MLDVEVFGAELLSEPLSESEVRRLCELATASAGVHDGHLAVEFVTAQRIAELNERHRGKAGPTDVLSFPIDGVQSFPHALSKGHDPKGDEDFSSEEDRGSLRELGDIVICPEHAADLREAIVHGALHLIGMDHEIDKGEMLALQAELLHRSGA